MKGAKAFIKSALVATRLDRLLLPTSGNYKIRLGFLDLIVPRRPRKQYWKIHRNSVVTHPERTWLGPGDEPGNKVGGCYIQGVNGIVFGGYCYIGPNVGIVSANHDPDDISKAQTEKPILIGRGVWIGMGAVILPGIQIGDYAIVGANSLVTRDIPADAIVGGNPAKVLKTRGPHKPARQDVHEFIGYMGKGSRAAEGYLVRRREYLRQAIAAHGYCLSESLRLEAEGGSPWRS